VAVGKSVMSMGRPDVLSLARGWMVWIIGFLPPALASAEVSSTGLGVRSFGTPIVRLVETPTTAGSEVPISGWVGTSGADPCVDAPR
jgi:hypothetical protein